MKEKLKEIIEGYKSVHKSGLNLKFFDCQKGDVFKDIKNELRQSSMFKEKKLIVATDPFLNNYFKGKFLEEAETFLDLDDIIILFQEGEIKKEKKLLNFLEKKAKTQKFSILTGQNLKNWVIKKFGKQKIEPDALDLLLDYVGSDLWRMSNEIEKLRNYRKDKIIKKEDVKLQVKPVIEVDIFQTIDAMAQRRKDSALRLFQKHLENGDSPLYLVSMINYQFRNLLTIKDFVEKCKPYGIILKKSGLHPFVVKKSYFQCKQFSQEELKKIYQKIFLIDLEIKTGKLSPDAGLEMLIAEI